MARELLFLTGSIVYSTIISSLLSISLAIRYLFSSSSPSSIREQEGPSPSSQWPPIQFYEGRVWHVRTAPVHHAFDYPVRYALIDLDRFSSSSAAPFALEGHLSAAEARRVTAANGPVLLLTIPKSVGYEQNPLSVYYCFDRRQDLQTTLSLKACIAQVTNTPWGERVNFVFHPGGDRVAKPLHVSPFMDMLGNWNLRADAPADKLSMVITVQHPIHGNYFTATLKAKRVAQPSSPVMVAYFFWLMPHRVAVWIYWHALKLWWKGVRFVDHPKYLFPTYRQDAMRRNRQLSCPYSCSENQNIGGHEGNCYLSKDDETKEDRWCIWKDARWPWS